MEQVNYLMDLLEARNFSRASVEMFYTAREHQPSYIVKTDGHHEYFWSHDPNATIRAAEAYIQSLPNPETAQRQQALKALTTAIDDARAAGIDFTVTYAEGTLLA